MRQHPPLALLVPMVGLQEPVLANLVPGLALRQAAHLVQVPEQEVLQGAVQGVQEPQPAVLLQVVQLVVPLHGPQGEPPALLVQGVVPHPGLLPQAANLLQVVAERVLQPLQGDLPYLLGHPEVVQVHLGLQAHQRLLLQVLLQQVHLQAA